MVHGEHGPGKTHARDGAPRDKDWLQDKGADVAYEGDVGVDLARVPRLADGKPAEEEDGEGEEPGETGDKWPEVDFLGGGEAEDGDGGGTVKELRPEALTLLLL